MRRGHRRLDRLLEQSVNGSRERTVPGIHLRLERLARPHVQVDRAAARPAGTEHGLSRGSTDRPQTQRIDRTREIDLGEVADGRTEELRLVRRLRRPAVHQLHRSVGSQGDQRNACLAGFHHRRQVVGRRRPRSADHDRRHACGPRLAEREEPGRPLVDDAGDVQPGGRRIERRQHQRRRAGTRARDRPPDAGLHQGADQEARTLKLRLARAGP